MSAPLQIHDPNDFSLVVQDAKSRLNELNQPEAFKTFSQGPGFHDFIQSMVSDRTVQDSLIQRIGGAPAIQSIFSTVVRRLLALDSAGFEELLGQNRYAKSLMRSSQNGNRGASEELLAAARELAEQELMNILRADNSFQALIRRATIEDSESAERKQKLWDYLREKIKDIFKPDKRTTPSADLLGRFLTYHLIVTTIVLVPATVAAVKSVDISTIIDKIKEMKTDIANQNTVVMQKLEDIRNVANANQKLITNQELAVNGTQVLVQNQAQSIRNLLSESTSIRQGENGLAASIRGIQTTVSDLQSRKDSLADHNEILHALKDHATSTAKGFSDAQQQTGHLQEGLTAVSSDHSNFQATVAKAKSAAGHAIVTLEKGKPPVSANLFDFDPLTGAAGIYTLQLDSLSRNQAEIDISKFDQNGNKELKRVKLQPDHEEAVLDAVVRLELVHYRLFGNKFAVLTITAPKPSTAGLARPSFPTHDQ